MFVVSCVCASCEDEATESTEKSGTCAYRRTLMQAISWTILGISQFTKRIWEMTKISEEFEVYDGSSDEQEDDDHEHEEELVGDDPSRHTADDHARFVELGVETS